MRITTERASSSSIFAISMACIVGSCGGDSTSPPAAVSTPESMEQQATASASSSGRAEPTYPAEPGIYLARGDRFEPMVLYTRNPLDWTYAGTQGLQSADVPACDSPCRFVIVHIPALDTTTLERGTLETIGRPASQAFLRANADGRRRPIPVRAVGDGIFAFEIATERRAEFRAVIGSHGPHGMRAMFFVVRPAEAP